MKVSKLIETHYYIDFTIKWGKKGPIPSWVTLEMPKNEKTAIKRYKEYMLTCSSQDIYRLRKVQTITKETIISEKGMK